MNEKSFEKVFNNMNAGVAVIGADGCLLFANQRIKDLFGTDSFEPGTMYEDLPESYRECSSFSEVLGSVAVKARFTTVQDTPYRAVTTHVYGDDGKSLYIIEEIAKSLGAATMKSGRESTDYSSAGKPENDFDEMILSDKAMTEINMTISRIAYVDSTILIQGESGTGKSKLAKHIHDNSNRAGKPFVTINCGSIPENLIESELFGYASGAFTSANRKGKAGQVELADGGTLFLDEIGLLPYNIQAKFLQLIQEKTYTPVGGLKSKSVDVRIIAATNEDLKSFVKERKFREDLYYRLRVIELFIPPLRERKDAIETLVMFFINKYNQKFNMKKSITPAAMSTLGEYTWPGNIRELQYVIERIIITSENDMITSEDIPPLHEIGSDMPGEPEGYGNSPDGKVAEVPDNSVNFEDAVCEFERHLLEKTFETNPSSYKVASALGLTQTKASRLLRKYGIR